MAKSEKRSLGYTREEVTELVEALSKLLINYQVHYHKLRVFHWNVEGPDFFELHEEFEKEYNTVKENIDIIAERIRVFGVKPSSTLEEILNESEIEEVSGDIEAVDMVKEVLKDYEILHNSMLDVLTASLDLGDSVSEQMATDFTRALETRNWMFTAWCKED